MFFESMLKIITTLFVNIITFLRIADVRAAGPETHFFDKHYHRGLDWYR